MLAPMPATVAPARRILVVDDTTTIHDDFRKIFAPEPDAERLLREAALELGMDDVTPGAGAPTFEVEFASQGQEGVRLATTRKSEGRPFSVAFVDMRMPPGWDGLETSERLWQADPDVQIVICTAYSDHQWSEIRRRLAQPDSLLILKKPFDVMEALQMANALAEKWALRLLDRNRVGELEVRVRERTRELEAANDGLRAAGDQLRDEIARRALMERQLQEAKRLESIGRIAAWMAHEINNPLSVVVTNLNGVRDDLEPVAPTLPIAVRETVRESLDEALVAANRMQRIVADMKVTLRSDARGWWANIEQVLAVVVRKTANDVRDRARVVTDFQATGPVRGNATRLEQVFVNLIVNAAQSLPEQHPDNHEIRVGTRDGDDGAIVVEVSDTGPGIPEELQRRIFEPFFTTKGDHGTGLGLAICESVVREAGGAIEVQSRPGAGATFSVRLLRVPAEAIQMDEQPAFVTPDAGVAPPPGHTGSQHVG